jgi:hypothetical protein
VRTSSGDAVDVSAGEVWTDAASDECPSNWIVIAFRELRTLAIRLNKIKKRIIRSIESLLKKWKKKG